MAFAKHQIDYSKSRCIRFIFTQSYFKKNQKIYFHLKFYFFIGATIFHIASKYNQTDVVKWIIGHDQEKNLRVRSNQGLNALHFACLNGSLECVKILLAAVPHYLNEKTKLGLTPIYLGFLIIKKFVFIK